jgi:hypothetical protein
VRGFAIFIMLGALGSGVSRFLLATHGEYKHRVKFRYIFIKRHITPCAPSNDKLSKVCTNHPANQRIVFQYINSLHDTFNARGCVRDPVLNEVFENTIEVIADLGCKRHK